jgi:hypothetical protein
MKVGLNRILSRVRIHGGDSGVSARATHHNVEKDLLITYVSALSSQADLGNVSRSTTERKKMSTKTTFKRVALVTVAAMGLGVLTSVAPASAAVTDSTSFQLTLSTTASGTTNYGVVSTTAYASNAAVSEVIAGARIAVSTAAQGTFAAGDKQVFTITGDATWVDWDVAVSGAGPDTATVSLTGGNKVLTISGTGADTLENAAIQVGANATGTITITGSGLIGGNSTVATTQTRTLYIIASAAATAVGTYNAAKSNVQTTWNGVAAGTVNVDESGANIALNGGSVKTLVDLNDAFGGAATAGSLVATVTGGLVVGWDGVGTTAQAVATDDNAVAYVSQGTANVAGSGTLTITYNGVVVGTKTVKVLGDLASITVTPKKIGQSSSATTGGVAIVLKDAASNVIPSGAYTLSLDTTVPSTIVSAYTNETQSIVVNNGNSGAETSTATVVTQGGKLTCSAVAGKATGLKLKALNKAGATITSAAFDFSCAGDIDSFTATFDKASYKAGEVAVLTVTSKDEDGNIANDVVKQGAVTVSSGAFTTTDGNPVGGAATGATVNGVATYKFVVGQTAGSYTAVVSVPGAATTTTATVAVAVTSANASEIAQLVKVIGTLLTTFTKQIAALIKALGKR